ncbi:hypothetical protein [Streptococcus pluranimalium]|uniref:Lipoprotein n=1 Tax=Streptococcus pluranimalium TaxID=82348 RepID=A0A345VN86_9STRE|nr:hypothetical protein [Streptococcus pluranimalium]AXJ14188.1 hypothetical protein Sp14A_23060 [Streptococcus pluranimalium]
MMRRKLIVILGLLGLCMAFLTACSSQPSKNADGTPSTLKSRYLGYYRSDTDNATYFDESTNEFNFNIKKSTISDDNSKNANTEEYVVLDEKDLKSNLVGEAKKGKSEASPNDSVFYIQIKRDDQAIYQVILSDGGKTIKMISLGDSWDQFVFTGTAKE